MFDVDVADPISDLQLPPDASGAAVLVRRKSIPIGFWMQERNGSLRISAAEVRRRIAAECGECIVSEALREETATGCSGPAAPTLTIAICTKDRTEGVDRLLRSISKWNAEILVIDNAPSDDSTRDRVAQTPGVRYVREPRVGLNCARNRALREARTEIVAFLDDDVVPDRGWLEGLHDAWRANRDAAGFTGQVLPMELETDAQIVFEKRGGFRRGFQRVRYGAERLDDPLYPGGAGIFGAGANMAFSTKALEALGGFDEALDTGAAVPGGGDLDIFYRIIRSGRALVYEPRFLVFHQHRRDMRALRRQYAMSWGLGFMCYLTKCLKTDPDRRVNLLRLMVWWFTHEVGEFLDYFAKWVLRRDRIPPSLLMGELFGGVAGLFGGYERSRRRIGVNRRKIVG